MNEEGKEEKKDIPCPDASTPEKSLNGKKRGRPKGMTYQRIKDLKVAKALVKTRSAEDAYLETHPGSTRESARKNAYRILTPEVIEFVKRELAIEQVAEVSRDNLVKLFMMVATRWMEGKEKTADFIRALENLKQLVPDFVNRTSLDDLSKKSDDELQSEIDKFLKHP